MHFLLHLSCVAEINDVFSLLTILLKLHSQLISFKSYVFQGVLSLINLCYKKKNRSFGKNAFSAIKIVFSLIPLVLPSIL